MKIFNYYITFFCATLCTTLVYSHSALSCTKKRGKDCLGFPRYYHFNHLPTPLPSSTPDEQFYASRDRQFILQPGINNVCPQMSLKAYTKEFPMAVAKPGENIILQHPPRGHASQPSSNVSIYIHPKKNVFPRRTEFNSSEFILLKELQFGNCVGLEKEVSWANCTENMVLPNLSTGIWTFWWKWDLNGIQYTDCFEVNVKKMRPN